MTVKSNKFAAANSREFYLQIYWNSGANFWEKLLQKNKYARTQFERVKKVLNAPLEKIEEWCKAARKAGKKTLGEFLFPKIENQKEVQKDIKKESKKPSTEKDRSDDYRPGL